jgi:hypothetical protein
MMKTTTRMAALAAAACLLTACEDASKAPAAAAIQAAETALAAVRDEAARFAPEQLKAVNDAVAAAKAKFAAGDFKAALQAASELGGKVKALGEAARARKDELAKAWAAAAGALPAMVKEIQGRIDELSAMKKLPKDVGAETLQKARAEVAEVSSAWQKAQASFQGGALAEAVALVKGLPERAHAVMDQLGMHKH